MIVLACETSTLLGSVALAKDDKILFEKKLLRQGSHSDVLNQFISDCLTEVNLKLSDIDCFATGLGPGSFTGLRISLNTIKTLSYIHQKPAFGVNSLFNLAKGFCLQNTNSVTSGQQLSITPIINAYKNMVYFAEYLFENNKLTEVKPPQVVRVQELGQHITKQTVIVGDGYAAYEKYFSMELKNHCLRLDGDYDYPTAGTVALLASSIGSEKSYISWHQLLPVYLRASEAEEVLAGIKYQAL